MSSPLLELIIVVNIRDISTSDLNLLSITDIILYISSLPLQMDAGDGEIWAKDRLTGESND